MDNFTSRPIATLTGHAKQLQHRSHDPEHAVTPQSLVADSGARPEIRSQEEKAVPSRAHGTLTGRKDCTLRWRVGKGDTSTAKEARRSIERELRWGTERRVYFGTKQKMCCGTEQKMY